MFAYRCLALVWCQSTILGELRGIADRASNLNGILRSHGGRLPGCTTGSGCSSSGGSWRWRAGRRRGVLLSCGGLRLWLFSSSFRRGSVAEGALALCRLELVLHHARQSQRNKCPAEEELRCRERGPRTLPVLPMYCSIDSLGSPRQPRHCETYASMLRLIGSAQQPLLGVVAGLLASSRPPAAPVCLPKGGAYVTRLINEHRSVPLDRPANTVRPPASPPGCRQRARTPAPPPPLGEGKWVSCSGTHSALPFVPLKVQSALNGAIFQPAGFAPQPPTPEDELDRIVAELKSKAGDWAATPPADRAVLLRACIETTLLAAPDAAVAGTDAKGSWGQGIGEELVVWVSGANRCDSGGALCVSCASHVPLPSSSTVGLVILRPLCHVIRRRCACHAPASHKNACHTRMHVNCTLCLQVPVVTGLREYAEALEAGGAPRPNGTRRRPDGQLVVDALPSGAEALLWGGFRGELWVQPGKEASQVRRRCRAGGPGRAGGSICWWGSIHP